MLSEPLRDFLLHGPKQKKVKALLDLGGAAHVRVAWRRYRQELLDACPMGRRPWGFWQIEQGLSHQPAGEAGELRLIKQLDLYRDDAEREFVQRRLAELAAERSHYWHSRVA